MPKIKIGTASWTDRSLIDSKLYYPEWCKSPEDRLRFYTAEFPMVEVDSSYYGLLSIRNSNLWVDRTPDDFTFNIKAFRLFTTRQTQPQALPLTIREKLPEELATRKNIYYKDVPEELKDQMWQMYQDALLPLKEANKLGVVVFQFPPWFMPKQDSYRHIEECKERLANFTLAVEFRNRYWLGEENLEEALGFLRHNGICFIAVDEPQGFASSTPPIPDVTGPYAIVRFHGRNRETWEKKGLAASSDRFDYYYPQEELEEWVPKIRMMEEGAEMIHLVFNTNSRDQGIANARAMSQILGEGLKPQMSLF